MGGLGAPYLRPENSVAELLRTSEGSKRNEYALIALPMGIYFRFFSPERGQVGTRVTGCGIEGQRLLRDLNEALVEFQDVGEEQAYHDPQGVF